MLSWLWNNNYEINNKTDAPKIKFNTYIEFATCYVHGFLVEGSQPCTVCLKIRSFLICL